MEDYKYALAFVAKEKEKKNGDMNQRLRELESERDTLAVRTYARALMNNS